MVYHRSGSRMDDCRRGIHWNCSSISPPWIMKKLITLALIAGLLTSCEEHTTSEPSPEAIGELITLRYSMVKPQWSTYSYEITDYMIHNGGFIKATTTDGETIITSTWTIHLY